jgi:hypothetical protein
VSTQYRMELIKAKLEILKLKANNYAWQCETPKDVREELEAMLVELNSELKTKEPADE